MDKPENFTADKVMDYMLLKNKINGDFAALIQKINSAESNLNQDIIDSEDNIVKIENGKLIINLEKSGLLLQKSYDFCNEHKDKIPSFAYNSIIPGISSYLMYKGVVKLYHKTAYPKDLESNLNSANTLKYLKWRSSNLETRFFNSVAAIMIVASLTIMSTTVSYFVRSGNKLNRHLNTTNLKKILLKNPFIGNNKGGNRWKYLIIFILILNYFYNPYFPFLLDFYKTIMLNWVRYIVLSIGFSYLIYNLFNLFLLNRFSDINNQHNYKIPKYLPHFLKKE